MSGDIRHDAVTWLGFAMGDLEHARSGRGARPRIVAFHAQQAAEKALKAALVMAEVDPPRTHDLEDLRGRLPADWHVVKHPADLTKLSTFAVDSRYPDDVTPVSAMEAATAVRQAMAVVRLVTEGLERRGISTANLKPR
jgi:HEPN domain-containing protein